MLWDYASVLSNTKKVRTIPFYPRLFCIFISANMSIVGAFLLGKWFLLAAVESTFLIMDGTFIFVLAGTSYEDWCKRWAYGWNGAKKLGTGLRTQFLEGIGVERTDPQVRDFYLN